MEVEKNPSMKTCQKHSFELADRGVEASLKVCSLFKLGRVLLTKISFSALATSTGSQTVEQPC
ncbi:hypothetical protein, partial [Corynebacterium striatum]|uniref:hypothetical protein n=1 Tax=Corynebacterium striatum TaxID=43770 RepID=UPI003F7FE2BE